MSSVSYRLEYKSSLTGLLLKRNFSSLISAQMAIEFIPEQITYSLIEVTVTEKVIQRREVIPLKCQNY